METIKLILMLIASGVVGGIGVHLYYQYMFRLSVYQTRLADQVFNKDLSMFLRRQAS